MPTSPRERQCFYRRCSSLIHAAWAAGLLWPIFSRPAEAQAPASPGTASPGNGGGASAPAAGGGGVSGPAPSVSSGRPSAITAGQVLTLPGIVARVLGNNSGLEIARERLQRAQESINQVNAQARPQFRLNANDTYSSYRAFPAALPVPTITNPALPDNGTIPAVTDQANSFSTAFIGGNGQTFGGGGGSVVPGVAGGGGSTAGTGTSATGTSGTSSATGAASPTGAGGTTGTTGGTSTTGTSPTGGTAAGPTTGANNGGAAGNAPANGTGTTGTTPANGAGMTGASSTTGAGTSTGAAPNTGAGAAPSAPAGTSPASPSTGAGTGTGATGMAMLAYPAIIADYVADVRTLLQPPSSYVSAPAVHVPTMQARSSADAAPQSGEQPRAGDPTTGTGTTGTEGVAARGIRNTYAAGGNVTQYLDLFGLVGSARTAEKDVRDFYALDVTRLQNETAYAAKNLFFNVLYSQALVATQQEQVAYAQENVRITQSRLRNGVVSRFDVLTAQTALATAQQQFTAALDQSQLAQAELSYLIGTDPDQPQILQPPPLPPLNQTVDLAQSTRIAERQRPELGQAGRNIDNAQRQVRLAASGLLPTVGLVGSGEYTSNASTVTPRSYGTVSAQVAVPLDDGGLTRSRVRSAQVQVQTQAITQEQLQLSVALEVRQATINIRNAQAQAASAQVSVTSSEEAVRLARERYAAGLGTFLDVLNALAQLAAVRTNLANAQYFYQSSLAQLVRAIGGR